MTRFSTKRFRKFQLALALASGVLGSALLSTSSAQACDYSNKAAKATKGAVTTAAATTPAVTTAAAAPTVKK